MDRFVDVARKAVRARAVYLWACQLGAELTCNINSIGKQHAKDGHVLMEDGRAV
jgi:hypothetical protein